MTLTGVCFWMFFEKVELPGVEPGSKRGSNMLSTCLAPTWFSCNSWIKATDRYLSFWISLVVRSNQQAIPDLLAPPDRIDSGQRHPGDVLSQHLVPGLSMNLLNSVTQQERNYFRQLNVWSLRLTSQQTMLGMLTYLFYPLSKPVSPGIKGRQNYRKFCNFKM